MLIAIRFFAFRPLVPCSDLLLLPPSRPRCHAHRRCRRPRPDSCPGRNCEAALCRAKQSPAAEHQEPSTGCRGLACPAARLCSPLAGYGGHGSRGLRSAGVWRRLRILERGRDDGACRDVAGAFAILSLFPALLFPLMPWAGDVLVGPRLTEVVV